MAWVTPTTTIEVELAGVGGGWTDISADLTPDPIVFGWGIKSHRPENRCAETGTIQFTLNNEKNFGSQLGYYSPWHASKRSGWAYGIRVRVKQVYAGDTRYKLGRLTNVLPDPGEYGERLVHCTAVDWMDVAAQADVTADLQVNKTGDEVFEAIVDELDPQPENRSIAASPDVYPFALDDLRDSEKALQTFADLARSEQGFVYVRRDATDGETLVYENRGTRAAMSSVLVTLDKTMHALELPADRSDVLNSFRAYCYPREVRTGIQVARLDTAISEPIVYGTAGITFTLPYTDPDGRDTRIGARNVVAPDPLLGLFVNTEPDGSGTEIGSTHIAMALSVGPTGVEVTLTNNGEFDIATGAIETSTGYLQSMYLDGDGLFSLQRVTSSAEDAASIAAYGRNVVQLDMRFQSSPVFAQAAADFWLAAYKDPMAAVRTVTFVANQSAALMTAAITGDISSLVQLVETVTGLTSDTAYFINAVQLSVAEFDIVTVTWWLSPATVAAAWLLGTAGASELGETTRVGYF